MDNWSSALRGALLPCTLVGLPTGHSLLIEFLYCHLLGPVSMALASNSDTHTHLFLVPTLKWQERKLYFGFVFSHHLPPSHYKAHSLPLPRRRSPCGLTGQFLATPHFPSTRFPLQSPAHYAWFLTLLPLFSGA